ncbi:DUF3413 domain-containing protein [Escherichia coli]
MFISVPVILLLELVFATWSWQKLRSLTRRRRFARPLAAFLFIAFIASHVVYIWADANFLSPDHHAARYRRFRTHDGAMFS